MSERARELLEWADMYGEPEGWVKRAQAAHMRAERLYEALASIVALGDDHTWEVGCARQVLADDSRQLGGDSVGVPAKSDGQGVRSSQPAPEPSRGEPNIDPPPDEFVIEDPKVSAQIQRCATCGGRGIVPQGFFTYPAGQGFSAAYIAPDKCRTCNGGGLVYVDHNPDAGGPSVSPVRVGER